MYVKNWFGNKNLLLFCRSPSVAVVVGFVVIQKQLADLAIGRERQLTMGKRAERTKPRLPVLNLPLCHWSSQLFDLRAPSSTDVPVLLLNQPSASMVT